MRSMSQDKIHNTRHKPGPKPLGERSMSSTERARKRRELMRDAGYKSFLLQVSPERAQHIQNYAKLHGLSTSAAFHELMDRALSHFVDCMERADYLQSIGEPERVAKIFLAAHLPPEPPPSIETLAQQFSPQQREQ